MPQSCEHTLKHVAFQEKISTRREKVKEELLSKTMKECTFQPKTNVRETRELIWRILHNEVAAESQQQLVLSSQ